MNGQRFQQQRRIETKWSNVNVAFLLFRAAYEPMLAKSSSSMFSLFINVREKQTLKSICYQAEIDSFTAIYYSKHYDFSNA